MHASSGTYPSKPLRAAWFHLIPGAQLPGSCGASFARPRIWHDFAILGWFTSFALLALYLFLDFSFEGEQMPRAIRWALLFGWIAGFGAPVRAQSLDPANQMARDILKQLVEINTTDSVGNVTTAAEAMAQRLRNAGFTEDDLHVVGPNDRKKNLVVRYRGTGKRKPILFIGHLDVVEALRSDWTTDPFEFIEKDGFFYGRGTEDMKEGDAILVTNFMRLRKENFLPDRDLILALTADEEGGSANGVDWLLQQHRDLIDADFVLNPDSGGVTTESGKPIDIDVAATEKLYADFQLHVPQSRRPQLIARAR